MEEKILKITIECEGGITKSIEGAAVEEWQRLIKEMMEFCFKHGYKVKIKNIKWKVRS